MREPLYWKIKRIIGGIIRRLSHHYYGCCENQFKDCRKCNYGMDEYKESWNKYIDHYDKAERSGSGE